MNTQFDIRPARPHDVDVLHRFIVELAEVEQFPGDVTARPGDLTRALFGEGAVAEAVLATVGEQPVGFALHYPSYSTVTGRLGVHLEDLYVSAEHRGAGWVCPCSLTWRARPRSAADGWSGGCCVPTTPRCASTGDCALGAWTRSRSCASTVNRCSLSQAAVES